jgi:hypothetical protein
MSDTWPDPALPGVPLNPEKDGWHYLKGSASLSNPRPVFWEVFLGAGRWADQRLDDPVILSEMEYLGPCLTPAEVDARVAEARRAALAEAAEVARKVPIPDECCHNEAHGRLSSALEAAMRIRALMEKKDE